MIKLLFSTAVVAAKKGKDFFLVGDYAWIRDMSPCDLTFDAMNTIKANAEITGEDVVSPDDIDAFITMGDNLYTAQQN